MPLILETTLTNKSNIMKNKKNDAIDWDASPMAILGFFGVLYFCLCHALKINPIITFLCIFNFVLFCMWLHAIIKLKMTSAFEKIILYLGVPLVILIFGWFIWTLNNLN